MDEEPHLLEERWGRGAVSPARARQASKAEGPRGAVRREVVSRKGPGGGDGGVRWAWGSGARLWLRPSKVRPWLEELGDSGRPTQAAIGEGGLHPAGDHQAGGVISVSEAHLAAGQRLGGGELTGEHEEGGQGEGVGQDGRGQRGQTRFRPGGRMDADGAHTGAAGMGQATAEVPAGTGVLARSVGGPSEMLGCWRQLKEWVDGLAGRRWERPG